jgi:hypothetical protein
VAAARSKTLLKTKKNNSNSNLSSSRSSRELKPTGEAQHKFTPDRHT